MRLSDAEAELQKAADNLSDHAWLARFRKGSADISPHAARDIAEYVDAFIADVKRLACGGEERVAAAVAAERDRAAKVCLAGRDNADYTESDPQTQAHMRGWNNACEHRAYAIRKGESQ